MKILLVCAGGFSTSFLMKKMREYWANELHEDLEVHACGFTDAGEKVLEDIEYDCVLIGPQAGHQIENIKEDTGLPCAVMSPSDYGTANCPNIHKLALELINNK